MAIRQFGKIDAEMAKNTKSNQPGTLTCDWSISANRKTCYFCSITQLTSSFDPNQDIRCENCWQIIGDDGNYQLWDVWPHWQKRQEFVVAAPSQVPCSIGGFSRWSQQTTGTSNSMSEPDNEKPYPSLEKDRWCCWIVHSICWSGSQLNLITSRSQLAYWFQEPLRNTA